MKNRFCAVFLIAVLTLSMLTGCAAPAAGKLSAEEAQAIALEHAGFSGEEVRHLRADPELWDRIPHYDVEFAAGRWVYEYEIHAETGAILSFEKDD